MSETQEFREAIDHLTNLVEEAEQRVEVLGDYRQTKPSNAVMAARQFLNRINHHEEEQ